MVYESMVKLKITYDGCLINTRVKLYIEKYFFFLFLNIIVFHVNHLIQRYSKLCHLKIMIDRTLLQAAIEKKKESHLESILVNRMDESAIRIVI